ncbi:MAG: hypothetical protein ACRDTW_18140, partial [Rhodococcus qingshengii]
MTKRPAVGIVLLSAALATGACSASVGTPQVDKSEVASQISTQLICREICQGTGGNGLGNGSS